MTANEFVERFKVGLPIEAEVTLHPKDRPTYQGDPIVRVDHNGLAWADVAHELTTKEADRLACNARLALQRAQQRRNNLLD